MTSGQGLLPLPNVAKWQEQFARQPFARRRYLLAVVGLVLLYLGYVNTWRLTADIPPDYRAWHEFELALPQNNPDLAYPQGKAGKYVRVSNHVTSACTWHAIRPISLTLAELGWGNHIQEMIMNAHMTFESGRTCVRPFAPMDSN